MSRIVSSIRGRLLLWITLSVSLLFIILGFSLYHKFSTTVYDSLDHQLHSKLQILKGLLHEEHGAIEFELNDIAQGEYVVPRSGHYYKVLIDGDILKASPSLVDGTFNLTSGSPVFYDSASDESIYMTLGPADEAVRVVRHDFLFLGKQASVIVAESLTESLFMLNSIKLFLLIILPLSIILVVITGLMTARDSLKPLSLFSSRIKGITHENLDERVEAVSQAEEIKGLAVSFNELLERLQTAFDSEERLISDAAHELRTPLSVIMTQCDVILQKERSTAEYAEALDDIRSVTVFMKRLVNDMLSLARLDSGMISSSNFKTVSLRESIERAVEMTSFPAEDKNITVKSNIPEDICISGDRDSVAEIFLNIIENAVKYSGSGSVVEISLTKDSSEAIVEIHDNGPGIDRENLGRIFDRFYRADISRSSDGTGLGLSIAKAIAEAHGGGIRVESEPGRGSSFFVIFPLEL